MTETGPTVADVEDARRRIDGVARETPVYVSESFGPQNRREGWL